MDSLHGTAVEEVLWPPPSSHKQESLMDQSGLRSLNRLLGYSLGLNPNGEPEYKWLHAKDLTFDLVIDGHTVALPQVPESLKGDGPSSTTPAHRYVLAKWTPTLESEDQWHRRFKGEMPYPRGGSYQVTDIILHVGVEPTEWLTNDVIGKVKALRELSVRGISEAMEAGRARTRKETDTFVSDAIDDRLPIPGHIPGKKDHVSFGGI